MTTQFGTDLIFIIAAIILDAVNARQRHTPGPAGITKASTYNLAVINAIFRAFLMRSRNGNLEPAKSNMDASRHHKGVCVTGAIHIAKDLTAQ